MMAQKSTDCRTFLSMKIGSPMWVSKKPHLTPHIKLKDTTANALALAEEE
jgi:hypothetical protein